MSPTSIPIIFEHDINKVENFDFILENFRKFNLIRYNNEGEIGDCAFGDYYVYVFSSDENTTNILIDDIFNQLKTAAKRLFNIEVYQFKNRQEKNNFFMSICEDETRALSDRKVICLESDMLISNFFMHFCQCLNAEANIFMPLFYYKYNYKSISYKGQEFKFKNFIKSNDEVFFQHSSKDMAFWALPYKPEERVFDWDEKLALTNDMWIKLNGAIPKPVPSSLLHNWGEYAKVVHTNTDNVLLIPNCFAAIHKFEKVNEDV
jgi:hypothetical protein